MSTVVQSASLWFRGTVLWAMLFLAWWAISEGDENGLIWGGLVSLLLTIWVQRQRVISRMQWRFLPGLVVFYLVEAFQGAVDVAIRAFELRPRTESYLMDYELKLTTPWAKDVWIGLIGLMPGTLAVGVDGNRVQVHILDHRLAVMDALKRLEWHLQRLAGENA
ncbi:MAG: Na+/H+ antiporter subunit E [Thiomicrospira sp.]|nr:Na+/H+ antiporter subunit E [Thiomicrospira sp.]PIY76882.1 MAG: sodium:proton antiporter [Piscirickettsiaceae bacterium CG_4_10_14_0_8_um_filter_44_742]NCN66653.1 Na+/H+ antiporter subunit E [Thiomicrospira sp.]NCO14420.1 Na+/H+ antiporter subunit E [Thiomicrospira sp.]NCO82545.1 Na+/H+ antiporter subunit E [Thiomicrospira sp.]